MTGTDRNPWSAFLGEAKANRLHNACALGQLRVMGGVRATAALVGGRTVVIAALAAAFAGMLSMTSGLEILVIGPAAAGAGYGPGVLLGA